MKKNIDKVIIGNIETLELPYNEYFDYIVCADVLEHLLDPWRILRVLKDYLADDGYLIASIPNIRYWRLIRDLVFFGKWKYQISIEKASYLNIAHLRFFTKNSIMEMFSSSCFEIREFRSNIEKRSKTHMINSLTLNLIKDFLTYQYLIKARKKNEESNQHVTQGRCRIKGLGIVSWLTFLA